MIVLEKTENINITGIIEKSIYIFVEFIKDEKNPDMVIINVSIDDIKLLFREHPDIITTSVRVHKEFIQVNKEIKKLNIGDSFDLLVDGDRSSLEVHIKEITQIQK